MIERLGGQEDALNHGPMHSKMFAGEKFYT
jgi:hypothetical protein